MTGLFVVKCELANLVVAIAIKVADKGLAIIGQVTTNLSLRGSVLRRFFVAIIVKVANLLAVNNGVARILLLNRIRKLLKIKTEVNTFLFASETDFGKELSRRHIVSRKLDFPVHHFEDLLTNPVKRLPFAARLPLEARELGGAVRILFYPLDIFNFTVFSKFRMPTNCSRFY